MLRDSFVKTKDAQPHTVGTEWFGRWAYCTTCDMDINDNGYDHVSDDVSDWYGTKKDGVPWITWYRRKYAYRKGSSGISGDCWSYSTYSGYDWG